MMHSIYFLNEVEQIKLLANDFLFPIGYDKLINGSKKISEIESRVHILLNFVIQIHLNNVGPNYRVTQGIQKGKVG